MLLMQRSGGGKVELVRGLEIVFSIFKSYRAQTFNETESEQKSTCELTECWPTRVLLLSNVKEKEINLLTCGFMSWSSWASGSCVL